MSFGRPRRLPAAGSGALATGADRRYDLAVGPQHDAAGGDAGAGGDEHVLDAVHLVDGGPPHLTHALGDAVDAVDVGLAQLAAVGVGGQATAQFQVAVTHELLGLALLAEPE